MARSFLTIAATMALASTVLAAPSTATTADFTTGTPAPTLKPAGTAELDAPVVPVRICTDEGARCLPIQGIEFVDPVLEFDQVAAFAFTKEGRLIRLNDSKCMEALPKTLKSSTPFFVVNYYDCEAPQYVKDSLQIQVSGMPTSTAGSAVSTEEPSASSTKAATETESGTEMGKSRRETARKPKGRNDIWTYNRKEHRLCAKVAQGTAGKACMFSADGYALLGTGKELTELPPRADEIYLTLVRPNNVSLSDQILRMLAAMTRGGDTFWAKAWDTNVVDILRYRMASPQVCFDVMVQKQGFI